MTTTVTARVNEPTRRGLERTAALLGISVSALVGAVLDEWLASHAPQSPPKESPDGVPRRRVHQSIQRAG